jgi:hypothetical protein
VFFLIDVIKQTSKRMRSQCKKSIDKLNSRDKKTHFDTINGLYSSNTKISIFQLDEVPGYHMAYKLVLLNH